MKLGVGLGYWGLDVHKSEQGELALAAERFAFDGETIQLPLPDSQGKSLKLIIAPVQPSVPIYLSSLGESRSR